MHQIQRERLTNEQYREGLMQQNDKVLKNMYQHFFPGILSFVTKNDGQRADAEDTFQEGIVILYRKIKEQNLIIESSFYTYLFAICKRIWWKKLSKIKDTPLPIKEEIVGLKEDFIEEAIEQNDRYQLYRTKFKELGADCQKLLDLFFQGYKMTKIAEHMGFGSAGYAKKRKFQCKKQLTELIKQDALFKELKY